MPYQPAPCNPQVKTVSFRSSSSSSPRPVLLVLDHGAFRFSVLSLRTSSIASIKLISRTYRWYSSKLTMPTSGLLTTSRRRRRFFFLAFSLALATSRSGGSTLLGAAAAAPVEATDAVAETSGGGDNISDTSEETCKVTTECKLCSSSDKDSIDECHLTGKVEVLTCTTTSTTVLPNHDDSDDQEKGKCGNTQRVLEKEWNMQDGAITTHLCPNP